VLAYDAVALIVNRNEKDSVFEKNEVADMLKGKSLLPYKPVFDGIRATSTVRFAIDSILMSDSLNTKIITAAKTSSDVVKYIAENKGYIGFVGVSWIGNPEDTAQIRMLKQVRIAWLPCVSCTDSSFTKPWQEEILTRRYPYSRGIFYVLKENHVGLGKSLINFMKGDRGQLIFRRGYVVPAERLFMMRETRLKLVKPIRQ
jgi:phosphate transport system substrate-binding protein